jgi:hypothetical protein
MLAAGISNSGGTMQYSILVRAVGVLAGVLIASQPALALKLLTEENPPLNYTEGK